jgi:hypothetical protein
MVLLQQLRERQIANIEPIFEQGRGFRYPDLEGNDIQGHLKILRELEKEGFLTSELLESILQCPNCHATEFSIQLSCTICKSTNITRGSVIEHLSCGNIDLDTKYAQQEDNTLVCSKCGKRLNAIGVDYAKPGVFYKCLNCKALLPQTENFYTCYNCCKSWKEEQLKELQLMKYNVELGNVSRYFVEYDLLPMVSERLYSKHGIKAESPGKVRGLSKIEHSFDLLVSHYESGEPILVADLMIDAKSGNTSLDGIKILAFYAKCLDSNFSTTNVIKKVLVTQSELANDAIELANAYGVRVIQSPDIDTMVSRILGMLSSVGPQQP